MGLEGTTPETKWGVREKRRQAQKRHGAKSESCQGLIVFRTSYFPVWVPLTSFSRLIALARTLNTILNKGKELLPRRAGEGAVVIFLGDYKERYDIQKYIFWL